MSDEAPGTLVVMPEVSSLSQEPESTNCPSELSRDLSRKEKTRKSARSKGMVMAVTMSRGPRIVPTCTGNTFFSSFAGEDRETRGRGARAQSQKKVI